MHRFAIVIFLMVLFCAVASSFSATIHVPSQQPTIQAGINAAVNGDTVLVAPGVYVESLVVASKAVVIKSSSGAQTTSLELPICHVGISVNNNSNFTFKGFAVNAPNGVFDVIDAVNSVTCFDSNRFGPMPVTHDLIAARDGGSVLFVRNVAHNIYGGNANVVVYNGTVGTILNNTFWGAARCMAIYSDGSDVRNNIFAHCEQYAMVTLGFAVTVQYNCYFANIDNGPGSSNPTNIQVDPQLSDPLVGQFHPVVGSPCIDAGDPNPIYNDPDGSRNDIGAESVARPPRILIVPDEFATIQAAVDFSIDYDTVVIAAGTYAGPGNRDIQLNNRSLVITGNGLSESTVIDCSGTEHRTHSGFLMYEVDSTTALANLTIRNASNGLMLGLGSPHITNIIFTDCERGIDGYGLESPGKLRGCKFDSNGYGILIGDSDFSIEADSCVFVDNLHGIDISSTQCTVRSSQFISNHYAYTCYRGNRQTKTLEDCVFSRNAVALTGSFSLFESSIDSSSVAVHCPFYTECYLEDVEIYRTADLVISAELEGLARENAPRTNAVEPSAVVNGAVLLINCNISENLGEIIRVSGLDGDFQSIGMKDCTFDSNGGGMRIGGASAKLTMDSCTYSRNMRAIQFSIPNPPFAPYSGMSIANCTFAGNGGDALVFETSSFEETLEVSVSLQNTVFFGNGGAGFRVIGSTADSALNQVPQCVNSFGNIGGNYVGISDPTGTSGNISENPFFCDTANSDFHIAAESPCAPANNSCSQQIGAFGVACSVKPGVTAVGMDNEALTNVLSPTPKIQWAVNQPVPSPQDSFLVAVGTDTDWQFAEKWNPAPFASADTFVTYDGSALLDGQTYYLRLRVHNTLAWSDWYQTSFRMNSVPTSPVLRAPTNLAVVGSTPILWVTNGTDAESDPLTYEFAGFHDTDCVAGPAINLTGVASGVDSTGGQIVDPLAENCRYWWMARAFDGYEYSPWTAYAQFLVNGTPEAPAAPTLDYPPLTDNKPIFTLLPTLDWQVSHDPDPGDTVRYKLELSDRANFSFALVRDSLLSTDLPLIDSLEFGTHYYWRVTAKDKSGLSAMSGVKEFWTWKLGDMNHSHGTDLSDLSLLIGYLTQTPRPDISPKMVADLTGDCKIDLSDLSLMVAYMTTSGLVLNVGCE